MVADGQDGTDGTDGTDGLSVFITYHDSEDEPSRPTGSGTSGGWHTNATKDVVWISQKVASSASSGTWGDPIRFKGLPGNIRSYGISMLSESLLRLPVQIRQDGPFLRIGRILPSRIRVTLQKTVITMSLHLLHLIPRHTSKGCHLRQEELIR